jgi:hypothetical protein
MKTGSASHIIQYRSFGLKFFSSVILFIALVLTFHTTSAQTTSISGIVNTYYKVIDVVPAKACVRVPNAAGLSYNDRVMLIQMKGATINTNATSSSFGDTISVNNAGNYEIATVCHVIGDSVFMVYVLLNNYTVADKVQLVKIPQYYNADVIDTLKPAAWNNATGTGGVLAIEVEEDLILNAHIYADSSGFKGGAYRLSGDNCSNFSLKTDYAYNADVFDPTTQDGAFKGEGVAEFATAISGGRGAPANGGGGGNNHNNGGGGGANLVAGGDGGGNSSSTGCETAIQGKGGKALSNHGGKKIFAGGGGGAGHVNNGIPNTFGGGNGGGIIFIKTKNLIGNGRRISANGQLGGRQSGDGAGGGGAGGTVIIDATTYTGSVTIQANGAIGGTSDNGNINQRCYGSGGGGGGGAIYFSGIVPPVTVSANGGNAGPETRRTATCNPAVPALAGVAGQIVPGYLYASSRILESSYCAYLLPVSLVSFKVNYINNEAVLKWEIAQPEAQRFIIERSTDGNHWVAIGEQTALEETLIFQDIDPYPQPGTNYYRLKMIDRINAVSYSPVQKIYIATKNDLVKIYPNPANKSITIKGNITSFPTLSLFDLSGKLIWKRTMTTHRPSLEIDLPALSKGIYLLRIGDVIKKLVIR